VKVGYLGPAASFSFAAATQAFPTEELTPYATIPLCLQAVERGEINYAIVPIENTIEGSVHTTLDQLFHHMSLPVQAEIVLPIHQQLMVAKQNVARWRSVKKVISHPQALAQSQHFLMQELPKAAIEEAPATTFGAQKVAEHPTDCLAAIGPRSAARAFDLAIVAEDIQDLAVNQTRFWIIGKAPLTLQRPELGRKMSIALTLPNNQAGSLHKALAAFSWREISLSKIESRPLKTHLGEYFFLIDIQLTRPLELVENALSEISLNGAVIKRFGDYAIYQASEQP
jgi:prephenate dehydratase